MTQRIIDAHHHIWRRRDLPWLMGPMRPRIFGPYEPIRRDYPVAEYLLDVRSTGVERSVYVQANWAEERFEDEVAWVQSVADTTGAPNAIVGYADFMAKDVRPQLDRLKKYRLMRGLRMQLHWHEDEMYRFASRPDLIAEYVGLGARYVSTGSDLAFLLRALTEQARRVHELPAGAKP